MFILFHFLLKLCPCIISALIGDSEKPGEKGCSCVINNNFNFSVVQRNYVQKTFGESHRKISNNALKCHDCLSTWTVWPVCSRAKYFHYNEMSGVFFVRVELSPLSFVLTPFYQKRMSAKSDRGIFPTMTLPPPVCDCLLKSRLYVDTFSTSSHPRTQRTQMRGEMSTDACIYANRNFNEERDLKPCCIVSKQ